MLNQGLENPDQDTTPQDWKSAKTRGERSRLIKDLLFQAASEVVGELGYEKTSITLITQKAGVAQGTFYNYFESRQDIFDQLLPALGNKLLEHISNVTQQVTHLTDKEELGFRGFFSFLKDQPNFFRIFHEASSFAPKAYAEYVELVHAGYVRFLNRSFEKGEIRGFTERELPIIAFVMMASRTYLDRYHTPDEPGDGIPDWVVQAYCKLMNYGLCGAPDNT